MSNVIFVSHTAFTAAVVDEAFAQMCLEVCFTGVHIIENQKGTGNLKKIKHNLNEKAIAQLKKGRRDCKKWLRNCLKKTLVNPLINRTF